MASLSAETLGPRAYVKRRSYSKRRFQGSKKARRALLRTKRIAKAVVTKTLANRAETKQFVVDQVGVDTHNSGSGYAGLLNEIPQGITERNRIGDTVQLRTLKVNYQLAFNGTGSDFQLTRVIIAWHPRGTIVTNGAITGIGNVIQNATTTQAFNSPHRS